MKRTESTEKQARKATRSSNEESTKWIKYLAALFTVFLFLSVCLVWLHVQKVRDGYVIARLGSEREKLLTVQRKLKLEWSQFMDPSYLKEIGKSRYGLEAPSKEQKLYLR